MANLQAQASPLSAPLVNFNIRVPVLVPLAFLALGLRLALASIHGFGIDIGTFQSWSGRLAHEGPWNFYQPNEFTDYAPGYMYVLLLIGKMDQILHFTNSQYEYVLKLPSIIADLASAFLLYKMLDRQKPAVQLIATSIYLFFPPALIIGAVWGQVDSILAFYLLLTVYMVGRHKPVAGAVAFSIGFLIKPQAVAALPFLAFWIIRDNPTGWWRPRLATHFAVAAAIVGLAIAIALVSLVLSGPGWMWAVDAVFLVLGIVQAARATALAILGESASVEPFLNGFPVPNRVLTECVVYPLLLILLLVTPFFTWQPWNLIKQLYNSTNVSNYRVNSFWAYNFWNTGGLFKMGFKCDLAGACDNQVATKFLGLSTRWWSLIMLASALGSIIFVLRKAQGIGYLALGTGLSTMAFYLFLTRMHERYVFPAFLPLLLACALLRSRLLWAAFLTMATVHFLNLYHVFGYYFFFSDKEAPKYPDFTRVPWLFHWLNGAVFGRTGHATPSLPLGIGSMETLQLMSILFVTAFVVMTVWLFVRSARQPPGAEVT